MRAEAWLRLMSGVVLVVVFAAGAMFGAGVTRWTAPAAHRPSGPPPGGPIAAMTRELALDDAQVATLEALAEARRPALDAIAREVQGRVRTELEGLEEDLRPHLRPDQVRALASWRAHRRPPPMPGALGPRGGPHGPPPHGPPPGGGPPPHGPPPAP